MTVTVSSIAAQPRPLLADEEIRTKGMLTDSLTGTCGVPEVCVPCELQ